MSASIAQSSSLGRGDATGSLSLLLAVGSLVAISILLAKIAAGLHVPMLTYLSLAMGGSGFILMVLNGGIRSGAGGPVQLVLYSLVAGALLSLGSALGYLTVNAVGAAFITLTMAFPPMLTWLLSFIAGMERFDVCRVGSLLISLAGGVLLAIGKGIGAPSDIGAILLACAIPAVLAAGNVYRTRCWPAGSSPRDLAAAMLISGAFLTFPFAVFHDGVSGLAEALRPPALPILLIAIAIFVAQYSAFFRLQQIAGPVFTSQIGSVAAIVGSPLAVAVLGEELPGGFVLAALLIAIGLGVFQYRNSTSRFRSGR